LSPRLIEALRQVPAQLGAYYHDLQSGRTWSWNGEDDFPAASVIKVPILLAVLRQAQLGLLQLDQLQTVEFKHHVGGAGVIFELHDGVKLQIQDLCRLMIVVSDNIASNLLLDIAGMDTVRAFMASAGMSSTLLGRRFMENPRPGRDNRTTALDMGRCLEALVRGELLDKNHTNQALSILRRQQFREKIPLMLPTELSVAHKTGELEGVRHDVALVEIPDRPYVLSLLTRKGPVSWEVDKALAQLSLEVYRWHLEH